MHDERLQNAEAQAVAGRGVGWFVGLLRVLLLAQFCWQRGVLQMWCSEENGTVAFSQEKRQEAAGISWSWSQAAFICRGPQGGGFEICSAHDSGFDNSPGFLRRDGHFSPTGGDQAEAQRARQDHLQTRGCWRPSRWRIWSRPGRRRRRRSEDVFKNTSRRRSDSKWPRMHGTRLRANIVKSERSWRRCGCFWTRRHRLGGKRRWHSRWLSRKRIHRLRREQEQVSAVTMPMHGMCPDTPQLWAAGLAAALPPEVAKQFQSWLGSVSSDAMGHQLLENGDDGLECEVDVLDAQSNSASSAAVSFRVVPRCSGDCSLPLPLKGLAGILTKPPQLRSGPRPTRRWRVGRRTRRDASPSGGLADSASDAGISAGSSCHFPADPRGDPKVIRQWQGSSCQPNCLTSGPAGHLDAGRRGFVHNLEVFTDGAASCE